MLELLTAPLMLLGYLFLATPFMAMLPAAGFGWLFCRHRRFSCLLAAVLWLFYLVYEYGMYLRILCTGECNIRIDLLIIYPLLLLFSAWASLAAWCAGKAGR